MIFILPYMNVSSKDFNFGVVVMRIGQQGGKYSLISHALQNKVWGNGCEDTNPKRTG